MTEVDADRGPDILLVEDDPLSIILVSDLLASRGYQVHTASDVSGACAQLRAVPPALVLLDVQIPGGGGEAVLAQIRAQPALASVPVIALTALAMAGDRERILALGFDDYISKPISLKPFLALIEARLTHSRSSRLQQPR